MVDRFIGTAAFDVQLQVYQGTPPFECLLTLFDNDAPVDSKKIILTKTGSFNLLNAFKVSLEGLHKIKTLVSIP